MAEVKGLNLAISLERDLGIQAKGFFNFSVSNVPRIQLLHSLNISVVFYFCQIIRMLYLELKTPIIVHKLIENAL